MSVRVPKKNKRNEFGMKPEQAVVLALELMCRDDWVYSYEIVDLLTRLPEFRGVCPEKIHEFVREGLLKLELSRLVGVVRCFNDKERYALIANIVGTNRVAKEYMICQPGKAPPEYYEYYAVIPTGLKLRCKERRTTSKTR